MKKTILIIFIILTSCNSNLKYLNKYGGYKEKPKKVEETSYEIVNKENIVSERYTGKITVFYDFKGRKIKTMLYKSDDTPSVGGIYYSYDQHGNEIEDIMYNIDSTINSKNNYKYNNHGQQIESIHISFGNIESISKSNFDRHRRIEEIISKYGDGSFREYVIKKYNKNWNSTELISYDSIGNQEGRFEFEYDKNGNKNSSKWYNAKGDLYNFTKTTFNIQNDPVSDFSYAIKGRDTVLEQITRFEYKYYKNNNIKERKLILNDEHIYILRYKYEY